MSDSAGMGEGAPSPDVAADALVEALKSGDFLVYPDAMAQGAAQAYAPFADNVINAE